MYWWGGGDVGGELHIGVGGELGICGGLGGECLVACRLIVEVVVLELGLDNTLTKTLV